MSDRTNMPSEANQLPRRVRVFYASFHCGAFALVLYGVAMFFWPGLGEGFWVSGWGGGGSRALAIFITLSGGLVFGGFLNQKRAVLALDSARRERAQRMAFVRHAVEVVDKLEDRRILLEAKRKQEKEEADQRLEEWKEQTRAELQISMYQQIADQQARDLLNFESPDRPRKLRVVRPLGTEDGQGRMSGEVS